MGDVVARRIEVLTPAGTEYATHARAQGREAVSGGGLEGLTVRTRDVF